MEVKEILRNLREKNNLTQEQMAERVNVSRQAISRWEMAKPNLILICLKLSQRSLTCRSTLFWVHRKR